MNSPTAKYFPIGGENEFVNTFVGLSTFQQNLASLGPIINKLVENPKTNLFDLKLEVMNSLNIFLFV